MSPDSLIIISYKRKNGAKVLRFEVFVKQLTELSKIEGLILRRLLKALARRLPETALFALNKEREHLGFGLTYDSLQTNE